jgi:hypothetical protein
MTDTLIKEKFGVLWGEATSCVAELIEDVQELEGFLICVDSSSELATEIAAGVGRLRKYLDALDDVAVRARRHSVDIGSQGPSRRVAAPDESRKRNGHERAAR